MSDELPEDPTVDHRHDPLRSEVEHVGPFQRTYLVVNGHAVPGVTVQERPGMTSFVVDDRLAFDVSNGEAQNVACLVAAVTANAHGFSCWPSTPGAIPDRKTPFGPVYCEITASVGDSDDTEGDTSE